MEYQLETRLDGVQVLAEIERFSDGYTKLSPEYILAYDEDEAKLEDGFYPVSMFEDVFLAAAVGNAIENLKTFNNRYKCLRK